MTMHYGRKRDEASPYTLPNIETFRVRYLDNIFECPICGPIHADFMADESTSNGDTLRDSLEVHDPEHLGWYWRTCLPGCLPDSDPFGPFATEEEALKDARADEEEEEPEPEPDREESAD